jgi:hypothetical protein
MNKPRTYKYLSKGELEEANKRSIDAGCRAVKPEYLDRLPDNYKYPIVFTLPWERNGWIRCQVITGADSEPIFLDIPQIIYENLGTVEVPVDEEVQ